MEDFDFQAEMNRAKEEARAKAAEKERQERKEEIENLIVFYRKIVSANNAADIFGSIDYSASKKDQANSIKTARNKILMEFAENRYNGQRAANPFPQEITNIAKNVGQLVNSFYDEANEKINGGMVATKEANRKNNQRAFTASIESDIAVALAAEEKINGTDAEKERAEKEKAHAEEERLRKEQEQRENAQKEQDEKDRKQKEQEQAEKEQAEREKANGNKQEEKNEEPEPNGPEADKEEGANQNAEKEKLILGLSEKMYSAFKAHGEGVWDDYVEELSGKNGEKGYLDKYPTPEKKANFIASLVEPHLREKIEEKMEVLTQRHDFLADDQENLIDTIIEQIKNEKTK